MTARCNWPNFSTYECASAASKVGNSKAGIKNSHDRNKPLPSSSDKAVTRRTNENANRARTPVPRVSSVGLCVNLKRPWTESCSA